MRLYRFVNISVAVLCVVAFLASPADAKDRSGQGGKGTPRLAKTLTNDVYHPMLINNIFNYYSNCGDGSFNNYSSSAEGFEFPKGANLATCIFEDGVVWGCFKHGNDSVQVGGSTYWHGLQAGRILSNGTASSLPTADDPGQSQYHLYRVRPDMKPIAGVTSPDDPNAASELSTLQRDEVPLIARYEAGTTAEELLQAYWDDWNNWPASEGAPYTDSDHNGAYDPTIDIPGVPLAGQTMWYVANDLSTARTFNLAGSNPIGIEFQRTIWAYNLSGALGSTIFVSNKIINKSGVELDSMYVVQWADPDLGNATDDFVGCDTLRSLGYVYNGVATDAYFASYSLPPPSAGFDFFQGPIVSSNNPSDTAIFDLQYRFGHKNLPMTSFNFFINANATYEDPVNADYNGTIQWYRLMRGLVGSSGAQYINPATTLPTTFVLSGDPVAGTGWIDGTIAGPGDRRMALCSGPFTMAAGDTQEVVVANLAGQGADYLSSVTVLKANDDIAQKAYNSLFSFPQPPVSPNLNVIALNGKIELDWGDPTTTSKTESDNDQGYTFQGYKVYQLATNSPNGAKLLATYYTNPNNKVIYDSVYDNTVGAIVYKPVVSGTNQGIMHTFEITQDYITGGPIINNRNYYFAVTAYNYNPSPTILSKVLESALNIRTTIPIAPAPGLRYVHQFGDSLAVTHSSGTSDGVVLATVIDPSALTGDSYKITFDTTGGNTTWALADVTATNTVIIAHSQIQTAAGAAAPGVTTKGVNVAVFGPPPGMGGWSIPSGTRRFSPVGGYTGLGLEGFSTAADPTAYVTDGSGTIGMAANFAFGGIGTTLTSPTQYHTVLLKLAAVDTGALWNPLVAPADPNYSLGYRYLRHASSAPADPSFTPWIINIVGTYPYQDFNYSVPFSAWDMETNPPTRLAVAMFENNAAGASVDGRYWPPTSSGDNTVNREFCFIFNKPYSTTPDPSLQIDFYNQSTTPLMWVMTCTRRNAAPWAAGDQFEIIANHINTISDIFTFKADAPLSSNVYAKADVNLINVFPNPYFGFNKLESDNYNRFVTFTHLPQKATIRIYNLAGILVRTLMKSDNSQTMQWNLQNEAGLPAAAGMYIVYLDLPGVGSTKILKLAIIPEQEFLHHY